MDFDRSISYFLINMNIDPSAPGVVLIRNIHLTIREASLLHVLRDGSRSLVLHEQTFELI